jgi:hypothetical protein
MRHRLVGSLLGALVWIAGSAGAAGAQTCIRIDEQYDTLRPDERAAARLLVAKQFELAGHRVVQDGCAATFTLSHIRLGTTISVTLSGPMGAREATALGLDDLPAVYSQMVRSLTTGQPMGLAVVDRSNVSASQDVPPRRVRAEGYWYARLGFGALRAEPAQQGAAFGFGYRAGFDRLSLDVSFLNGQLSSDGGYYVDGSSLWSLIKLQGLVFTNPTGNRSPYFGGGLSYGRAEIRTANAGDFPTSGRGAGLQADLTAGYEFTRAMSTRVFVQADVTLPFYEVRFERFSYPTASNGRYLAPTVTFESRYAPSVALSVGFGWQGRSRR